jgi:selenocysteine lyase/cysteine desulfurase
MKVDEIRALFPGLHDTIYLNTAAMAVGCASARAAYERAVERWSAGRFDWTEAERAAEDARSGFAEIVGAHADEIAIVPAVSIGAGLVASNMPAAKRGESIVIADNEFSSNYFPWLMLRERGYEVRAVPWAEAGISGDAYGKVADGGTRLIAVSAVHSSNGFRTDLAAVRKVADRSGAWLFVDASQAVGAVPIDVVRDGVDFLAASGHKFLLGSRGIGYLFVRRELLGRVQPVFPGWKAARKPLESFYGPSMDLSPTASKLDTSVAWFGALADEAGLGVLRHFGISRVLERNSQLSRRLHDALAANRCEVSPFPEKNRSTIVSLRVADTDAAMKRLREANVVASVRGGRVRLAAHFYNLEQEIDRVAELLAEA